MFFFFLFLLTASPSPPPPPTFFPPFPLDITPCVPPTFVCVPTFVCGLVRFFLFFIFHPWRLARLVNKSPKSNDGKRPECGRALENFWREKEKFFFVSRSLALSRFLSSSSSSPLVPSLPRLTRTTAVLSLSPPPYCVPFQFEKVFTVSNESLGFLFKVFFCFLSPREIKVNVTGARKAKKKRGNAGSAAVKKNVRCGGGGSKMQGYLSSRF